MANTINTNQVWTAVITIGNLSCPCFQWSTDVGTYGQIGRGHIKTSIAACEAAGINLTSLNAAANGGNNIPILISVNNVTIFGGYYLMGSYQHDEDEAEIHFRDYACVLFDSKTSIAELNPNNQTVASIVTQICQQKGLNPQLNIPDETAAQNVGAIFNSLGVAQGGANFGSYPRSYWTILVLLARACAANVYTLPTASLASATPSALNNATPGTLFFESIPTSPVVNRLYWMPRPAPGGVGPTVPTPIRRLGTVHQPQRNKSFVVIVKSFHGPSLIISAAAATVSGDATGAVSTIVPSGSFTGSGSGAQIRNLLSARGLGLPEYEFRVDGLTPAATQQRAEDIANQIACRLFIQTAVIDFDSSLMPLQQVLIIPEDGSVGLLGFSGQTMYINGVSHTMNIDQGNGVGSDGLMTVLKLLNLAPVTDPLAPEDLGAVLGGGV